MYKYCQSKHIGRPSGGNPFGGVSFAETPDQVGGDGGTVGGDGGTVGGDGGNGPVMADRRVMPDFVPVMPGDLSVMPGDLFVMPGDLFVMPDLIGHLFQ